MSIRKLAAAAFMGAAAVSLSACATGLNTQVSRHQAAQIAPGQTFYIVPFGGTPNNQFYRYAGMVAQSLEAQGHRPAGAPQVADMIVKLDYGVDQGRSEVVVDYPYYGGGYGGPYGYFGRPYWSRWGGGPFYYGWGNPYYGGYGFDPLVSHYTIYTSFLDMDIVRRVDSLPLFEGHVKARSESDNLDALVPNLVTAMFTNFPGQNGETVRITVPPRRN
jgi:hypothetical protein